MIMLIEAVQKQKRRLLQKTVISVDDQIILGMKVKIMTVHMLGKIHKWQEARLKKRITEILSRLRINAVLVRTDFPYPEWFDNYRKPNGKDLLSRLLGTVTAMNAKEHNAVYVHIGRVDRSITKTLFDLCQSFRHIMFDRANVDIADLLYKTYGASIIIAPTAERVSIADAAVFFNEPLEMPEFKDDCVIVKADDSLNMEFAMTNGGSFDIPDGYPQIPLISEAILRGCIGFDDICIMKSEISP